MNCETIAQLKNLLDRYPDQTPLRVLVRQKDATWVIAPVNLLGSDTVPAHIVQDYPGGNTNEDTLLLMVDVS